MRDQVLNPDPWLARCTACGMTPGKACYGGGPMPKRLTHPERIQASRALALDAHDREVAAKALREMSRKLVEMRLDPNLDRHASDYWSGVFQGLLAAEQYVSDEAENARADQIEAGTYLPPTH